MKQANRFYRIWIAGAIVTSGVLAAKAAGQEQDQISSFAGLQLVEDRFGPTATEGIVEMRGRRGQTQPESWELIVYDQRSPFLMKEFWIGGAKTIDRGPYQDFYPDYAPDGFINRSKLQIDSTAAFRILNGEAERAGVGFDSISYHLRCREFSDEPLWRLTALDIDDYPVGRVDLSGATGEVMRTVWYFWEDQHRGAPRIVDSALLGGPGLPNDPVELGQVPVTPPLSAPVANKPEKRTVFGIFTRPTELDPVREPDRVPLENLRPFTPAAPVMPAVPPGPPVAVVEPVDSPAVPPQPAPAPAPAPAPEPQPDSAPLQTPPAPAPQPEPAPKLEPEPPTTDPNAPMPPEIPADLTPKRPTVNNPEGDPATVVPLPPGSN